MKPSILQFNGLNIIYECFTKKDSLTFLKLQKIPYVDISKYEDFIACSPYTLFSNLPLVDWNIFYFKTFWALDRQLHFGINPKKMYEFLYDFLIVQEEKFASITPTKDKWFLNNPNVGDIAKNPYVEKELKKLFDGKTKKEKIILLNILKSIPQDTSKWWGYENLFQKMISCGNIDKKLFQQMQFFFHYLKVQETSKYEIPFVQEYYLTTLLLCKINNYWNLFKLLIAKKNDFILNENFNNAKNHNFLNFDIDNKITFDKKYDFEDKFSLEEHKEKCLELYKTKKRREYAVKLTNSIIENHFTNKLIPTDKDYNDLLFFVMLRIYIESFPQTNAYWTGKKALFTTNDQNIWFLEFMGAWNQLKIIKSFEIDGAYTAEDNDGIILDVNNALPPIDFESLEKFAKKIGLKNANKLPEYLNKTFAWRFPNKYIETYGNLRSVFGQGYYADFPYLGAYIQVANQMKKGGYGKMDLPQTLSYVIDSSLSCFGVDALNISKFLNTFVETFWDKRADALIYIENAFMWSLVETIIPEKQVDYFKTYLKKVNSYFYEEQFSKKITFKRPHILNYIYNYQNQFEKLYLEASTKLLMDKPKEFALNFQQLFPLQNNEKILLLVDNQYLEDLIFMTWLSNLWWHVWPEPIKQDIPQFIVCDTSRLDVIASVPKEEWKYIIVYSLPDEEKASKHNLQKRLLHIAKSYFQRDDIWLLCGQISELQTQHKYTVQEEKKIFTTPQFDTTTPFWYFQKLFPWFSKLLLSTKKREEINVRIVGADYKKMIREIDKIFDELFSGFAKENENMRLALWKVFFSLESKDAILLTHHQETCEKFVEQFGEQIFFSCGDVLFPSYDSIYNYHTEIKDLMSQPIHHEDMKTLDIVTNLAHTQMEKFADYINWVFDINEEMKNFNLEEKTKSKKN